MDDTRAVDFSVNKIELINYYDAEVYNSPYPGIIEQKFTYYVQNKSNFTRKVRVAVNESSDPAYRLLRGTEEKYLAAGLKLPIVLQYSPDDAGCHKGEIAVYVDDEPATVVPIEAIPPKARFEFCPSEIDFGCLVCEHQLACHSLTITNTGSKEGDFMFLVDELPSYVTITPVQMTLKPGQSVDIKVELLCNREGSLSEHLRIVCDGYIAAPLMIPLSALVVTRKLEMLDPSNASCSLERVDFGNVYYGTTVRRDVLLFNNSPVSTHYLAMINSDVDESVDGININVGLEEIVCSKHGQNQQEQSRALPGETLMQVTPVQGSLDPYEKKMITLSFAPRSKMNDSGWFHRQSLPIHREYALFVQFMPVGVNKAVVSQDSILEIAITGIARALQLTVQPGTSIEFDSCVTGQLQTKQLLLSNGSDVLPIDFQCHQVAHYKCSPNSGRIIPGEVMMMTVTFQPRQLGKLNCNMQIDFLWPNKKNTKEAFYSIALDLHGNGIQPQVVKSGRKKQLASPNHLACSIRPHDKSVAIETPHTRIPRYTYVDPDYCYEATEVQERERHRQSYVDYNRERRAQREWKQWEKAHVDSAFANKLNLSVPLTSGLDSPPPPLLKVANSPTVRDKINTHDAKQNCGKKMLTSKYIDSLTSVPLEFIECHPSKRTSQYNKCALTPSELNQILIEPEVLDFGSIVVDHVVEKCITLRNFSKKHVSIQFKLAESPVWCKNYDDRHSVFILAPHSFTKLTLVTQQHNVGVIERCIEYSINFHHTGYLPVKASVIELTLSLSTTQLTLTESELSNQAAGLRGSVVISNKHSVAAEFQWHAREEVDTKVFYMTHPSGTVPAASSLKSEFICHPSYDCPASAQFLLVVRNKNANPANGSQHNVLTLIPEFNKPHCKFREKRLLFGTVPLNLTTVKTVHIENKGNCHAYFKIRDASPHSGLNIYCENMCVPIGGAVELKVVIKPEKIGQFDVKMYIDLREGKSYSLRIAGNVEYPMVSVSKDIFRFGGVYRGATATIPFILSNKGSARVQLQFDLSYLSEFSLVIPSKHGLHGKLRYHCSSEPKGVYVIDLPKKSDAHCELQFCPQTVASYDYQLPVLVNGLKAPSPPASPWPPSNTPSTITLNQNFEASLTTTPIRRVLATVLVSPLLVSKTLLNFAVHPGYLDETNTTPTRQKQVIKLSNVGEDPLSWSLDCSNVPRLDDKTFQFFPLPEIDESNPFCMITTMPGTHLKPGEEFAFTALCCPSHHGNFSATIPLILNGDVSKPYRNIELRATFPARKITAEPEHVLVHPVPLGLSVTTNFTIFVEYFTRPVELLASLPGVEEHVHLDVRFPTGSMVENTSCNKVGISCQLEFSSTQPISMSDYIIVCDKTSNMRKRIPFTVVADNSLFTIYTFQAHKFNSISEDSKKDTFPNQLTELSDKKGIMSDSNVSVTSMSFDDVKGCNVTASSTFTDLFLQDSISAVCRWLSVYGWSNGVRSLLTPTDFRVRVGEDLPKAGVKQRSNVDNSRGLLIDLLTNLCGRAPPGTPLNLPPCTTSLEKVNQLYSSYDSVISFLRNQGGLLWCVIPEALLDHQDFLVMDEGIETNRNASFNPQSPEEFDCLSKQAWTHLLMQIIKVLVLPRVINHIPEFLKEEVQKIEPLDNSMYSTSERVLLAWLNFHYKNQRERLLRDPDSGLQKLSNFDVDLMDSTVLACVLIAYCPFLIDTHFEQLYTHPSSPEQCSHNAVLFVSALQYIGIDYDIQPTDLCSANPVYMILFVIHLYERMSAFKPKKTLTFETVLGESVNQQLLVENSSMKQMEYHILIRGENAEDFHIANASSSIMLAGRQSNKLCLYFRGHSLDPSSAVLLLVARGSRATAATSVQSFRLQGHVTKAKPWLSSILNASLYSVQSMSFAVTSPFAKPGLFDISLSEAGDKNILSSISASDTKPGEKKTMIAASSLQKRSDDQVQMFHVDDQSQLHLEPGHTSVLILKFVPLMLKTRHCAVILRNKQLGDVILSIFATVRHPNPIIPESRYLNSSTVVNAQTRTLHLKAYAGQTVDEEIIVHKNNAAFEHALMEISKWDMSHLEVKRRIHSKSFKFAILSTAIETYGVEDKLKAGKDQDLYGSERFVFSVEGSDNKHFSHPEEVSLLPDQGGDIVIPIKFLAKSEGQYECRLILTSLYDVRVIVIESTVLATGRHAQLEFKTKSMMPLTQDIPLVNPSTVDWPLVATLNGTGFRGPDFIVAQCLSTTSYPLTFSPKREGIVKGDLHLVNNTDKSEYVFHLIGIADRPIAQDHIQLHVQAKTSITHILHVQNHHDRTMVFKVESDLDFISGPSTITIGGDDIVDYPLLVAPRRQGFFTGAVAFVAQAVGRPNSFSESLETTSKSCAPFHIWFQVDCTVDAALPDQTVTVSCPTFSSSTVQLNIVNPYPYQLRAKVTLEGRGLSGPDHIQIEQSKEASYPLTFTPTVAGQTKGRVVFDSIEDGEFWYELHLIAENPKPTHITPVSCELGKTCSQSISLTNPLDVPVKFKCHNTNTKHFIIIGIAEGQITVDPHSSADVHIRFKPSAIGAANHATELVFTSEQFGSHKFYLRGLGVAPSKMDPLIITANLKSSSMQVINFTNPLDVATQFSVSLKGQDLEHFCLLMKRTNSITLQPGVSLDIPVMFAPEVMRGHKAEVIVVADESFSKDCILNWCYPVVGQPELRNDSTTSALSITCRAKERFEQKFCISLMIAIDSVNTASVQTSTSEAEILSTETPYSYKLVCPDAELCSLVEKSAGIRLLGKKIKDSNSDTAGTTLLEFIIVFTPPKAFTCSCDLYITGRGGAVWIFPLQLLATPANPDDIVVVEAVGLNKEAHVSFRLTSLTEHPVPFTARLASGSDSEISVSPTSGELAPVNTMGTLFCITYKPTIYGRKHHAKFIVQSDSNEWCYEIVGKVPTFSGPTGTHAVVQHRSSYKTSDTTRNYVHKNLRLLSTK